MPCYSGYSCGVYPPYPPYVGCGIYGGCAPLSAYLPYGPCGYPPCAGLGYGYYRGC